MEPKSLTNVYLELAKEARPEKFEKSFKPNEFVKSDKYQTDFLFVKGLDKPVSKIFKYNYLNERK